MICNSRLNASGWAFSISSERRWKRGGSTPAFSQRPRRLHNPRNRAATRRIRATLWHHMNSDISFCTERHALPRKVALAPWSGFRLAPRRGADGNMDMGPKWAAAGSLPARRGRATALELGGDGVPFLARTTASRPVPCATGGTLSSLGQLVDRDARSRMETPRRPRLYRQHRWRNRRRPAARRAVRLSCSWMSSYRCFTVGCGWRHRSASFHRRRYVACANRRLGVRAIAHVGGLLRDTYARTRPHR